MSRQLDLCAEVTVLGALVLKIEISGAGAGAGCTGGCDISGLLGVESHSHHHMEGCWTQSEGSVMRNGKQQHGEN